jgi:O-antigen ligase
LLPFGTLPVQFAFTPSLIDSALGLFLAVYLFQWMTGRRRSFRTTPVHIVIVGFILLMVFAFVRGLPNAPLTPGVLRRFLGLMANIALVVVIVDVVRTVGLLRRLVVSFMVIGALSAAVGIVLWSLNDVTAELILNRLGRIGYPVGGVLRYRENRVQILNERAIGTWIDPNAYGGFLMMVGALIAPQLLARRPVMGRRWAVFGLLACVGLALFLSDSRGSMLGLLAGVGLVALIRYRRLLWLMALAGGIALFLPLTQAYINRLVAGFTAADLETQMRLGEYKDALILIRRYPVLGVGFSAPPDIDLYIGFASTYLTIAANAGLAGLLAYLATVSSAIGYGYRRRTAIAANDDLNDVWLGLLAGVTAALVGGIFDHFYFNIEYQATSLTFWLYVGLLLAAARLAGPPDEAAVLDLPRAPALARAEPPPGEI